MDTDFDDDVLDINDHESQLEISFHGSEDFADAHNDLDRIQDSVPTSDSMMARLECKLHHEGGDVAFGGVKYTDAEIDKMKHDVDMAESEVAARKSDVSNWESKVSLNDTKEHRANGDYAHAVSRLNEAKQKYNYAVERLNSANSKLRNAQ